MRANRPSMEALGLRRWGVEEEEDGGVAEEEEESESSSSSSEEDEEDSSDEETVRSIASPFILSFFSFLTLSCFPLGFLFCFS